MRPLMYKHRPSYPALFAAAFVLVLGYLVVCWLAKRADAGLGDESTVMAAGCFSCAMAGTLVVAAFARYQFTHLWKNPDPAFARKARKNRRRGRR